MLTVKQKEVLDYIQTRLEDDGVSPSFREIQAALGLKSVSTVTFHVQNLIEAGYLTNVKGYRGRRALQVVAKEEDALLSLPLLGAIAAGCPIEAITDGETIAVPPVFAGPGHYALKVQGDSMIEDGVLDGDVIIVRQTDTARSQEMVVTLINGEATLKRLVRQKDKIELHPANPNYPVIHLSPEDDFRIQGVAVGVIRRF